MHNAKVYVTRFLPLLSLIVGIHPIESHAQPMVTPAATLRSGFANPPAEAKLRCYWRWSDLDAASS